MKRIAGIFRLDGTPVHSVEIDRMLAALNVQRHAEQRDWIYRGVGLGCTWAARSGDQAPDKRDSGLWVGTPKDQSVIVFDGRIDNRQDLLAALKPGPVLDHSRISDAEITLAAYEKWELDCPKHLIGDFAFAIWDPKQHRLICVRDHFGVKPFYYYRSQASFVFASTAQAVLASGHVPPAIYEERIADFLVNPLEGIDKSSTFYKDVFRLPPAHILIVTKQGMTLERYWELCPTLRAEQQVEEEYIEAFEELLTEAVRCRLFDTPASASMLSGGMDS